MPERWHSFLFPKAMRAVPTGNEGSRCREPGQGFTGNLGSESPGTRAGLSRELGQTAALQALEI